jgi:3'-5' exoribonuclease
VPAAASYHHSYIGGLLEHTLSVAELAENLVSGRPEVDRDLLLMGVLLHDAGKIEELSSDLKFDYTDPGRLVGHLTLGVLMLERKLHEMPEFPRGLADEVRHLILSHHGMKEWGSPVLPATAEAIALHYLDNLDAKLHGCCRSITQDGNPDSPWTEFNKMFGVRLYKGWQHGLGETAEPPEDRPAPRQRKKKTADSEDASLF